MFTKSILPGDWVKVEPDRWYEIKCLYDIGVFIGKPLNNFKGRDYFSDEVYIARDAVVQRIGDRPLLEARVIEYIPGCGYCECRRVDA
jgi:hypothetical protein